MVGWWKPFMLEIEREGGRGNRGGGGGGWDNVFHILG